MRRIPLVLLLPAALGVMTAAAQETTTAPDPTPIPPAATEPTHTSTPTSTPTSMATPTPTLMPTSTPTPLPTSTPTSTSTPTPTPSPTSTPTRAATPTPRPAATATPSPRPHQEPFDVAYYYRIRWGFEAEFERLYYKNHFPILMAQKKAGRIRDVRVYRPVFHGDGRADWTFLVVIRWSGWNELGLPSQEEATARELFRDFETWRREEQRRFELVEAHWDVGLKPVDPPQ